jgi:hypothetical protein
MVCVPVPVQIDHRRRIFEPAVDVVDLTLDG